MVRKKVRWGPSNALWRWQHHKKMTAYTYGVAGVTRRKTRRVARSVRHMAKRRKSSSNGGGILGKIRSPMLKGVADGYIAGTVTGGSIPGYLAAYIKGGLPGVVACFGAPMINSFGGGTRISSATVLHG